MAVPGQSDFETIRLAAPLFVDGFGPLCIATGGLSGQAKLVSAGISAKESPPSRLFATDGRWGL